MSPKLRFPRVRSMSYHRLIITLKYLQPIHFLALRSPAPGGGSPSPSSTIHIVSSNHLPLSAAGWSPPARPPPAHSQAPRAPPGLLRSTTASGKPPDSSVREATPARLPGRRLRLPPRLLPTNFAPGRPWTPPHCH